MRILNRLGGIELSQAYACIKAISKKKTEFIAQARAQFLAGAAERKVPKETATKVFDLIVFFGGYGFNKSHSTAYALLAFQTAYLKAHYPTEFMAALLSSEIDGAERDKLVEHIDECRRMKIEVLRPDINLGSVEFQVAEEGKIAFALSAIKGVGQKAVEAIVAAREAGGPFASLDDLFERVPLATVTQACVEALDQGGRLRRLRGPPQPVAGRPASRRAVGPGEPERPQARPGEPLRRLRVERLGRARRRAPEPARHPRAARRRAPGRGEEGPRLLHVEPPPDPPRGPLAGPGHPPRGGARRGPREVGGDPGGDDLRRPGQERPEEPVGPDPDGQALLRGPDRDRPVDALARGIRQERRPRQERPDRLRQGDARPPPRPRRADHHQDHPPRPRAPPSSRAGSSSGSTRGSTRRPTSSACSAWSGSIRATSTSSWRSSA